jgi:hypothetical protein
LIDISCIAVKLGELLSDSPKRIVVAAETPPINWRCSAGLPPWIARSVKLSPAVPPTSCEASAFVLAPPTLPPAPRMIPGWSAARLMPRRPVGIASTTSFVTTFWTAAL